MLQQRELEADFELLAGGGFYADFHEIALEGIALLTPPERISITDCAAQHRLIPNAEGGARLWSPTLTPYINGIQEAMDDPLVRVIAVPKPARTGGTVAAENWLFKRLKFGPAVDVLWYLPGALVDTYVDTTVTPFFDLHADIAAKLGPRPTDRKRKFKRVAGKVIEYLAANAANVRGKQAPIIIGDEIDGYPKRIRSSFRQQMDFRGRAYGNLAKGYICSHPDAGWVDGVAAIWLTSNRGIWYWRCPDCAQVSSPCPTAEWRMRLDFTRDSSLPDDDMLDLVEASAAMVCPHCGSAIDNAAKESMNAGGFWVFDGQTVALDGTVTGQPKANATKGFWIHGTMSPFIGWGKLAREFVAATVFFERTGNPEQLREVTAKSLGEVYEGPAGRRVNVKALLARMDASPDAPEAYRVGEVPKGVRFITCTVDVGANRFDTAFWGWGADGECWLIARETLTAIETGEKLQPPLKQAHWDILRRRGLDRRFPLKGRPGWTLGVAIMLYDTGGAPGTTSQAREFTRRMMLGPCRGENAYRIRAIKGASLKKAPELGQPREVNRDDKGKPIVPAVFETDLGVHRLKITVSERLAIDAPGPGFVHLPAGGEARWVEELTNERLIDDAFVRNGDNETFDLLVYAEAARLMLKPDRKEIDWIRPPIWARPERIEQRQGATPKEPQGESREDRKRKLIERISVGGSGRSAIEARRG